MPPLPSRPTPRAAPLPCAHWRSACAHLLSLLVLLWAVLTTTPAVSAPIPWRESEEILLTLGAPQFVAAGSSVTVTFEGTTVENLAAGAQHAGVYFAWNWITRDSFPGAPDMALFWNNGSNSFEGHHAGWANVTMTIARGTDAPQYLLLSGLPQPSQVGVERTPYAGADPITAQGEWSVPLLDFGMLLSQASVEFDLVMTLNFSAVAGGTDAETLASDWSRDGLFQFDGRALVGTTVPEPGSLALVGCALGAAALATRRRRTATA